MNEIPTAATPPSALETSEMIREEILLRPARRAAAFCAIVAAALLGPEAGELAGDAISLAAMGGTGLEPVTPSL